MANVQLRGITKRFGSHVAVSDVTFEVSGGEFVVLVGRQDVAKQRCYDDRWPRGNYRRRTPH